MSFIPEKVGGRDSLREERKGSGSEAEAARHKLLCRGIQRYPWVRSKLGLSLVGAETKGEVFLWFLDTQENTPSDIFTCIEQEFTSIGPFQNIIKKIVRKENHLLLLHLFDAITFVVISVRFCGWLSNVQNELHHQFQILLLLLGYWTRVVEILLDSPSRKC